MDSTQSAIERERLEHASSDQIRADIRGTRRSMDETLDHLGERLHPRHLLEDVIDLFRGDRGVETRGRVARTTRDLGRSFAREVKDRPLPALLVGAGLAWWLFDAMGNDDEEEGAYSSERADLREYRSAAEGSGAYVPGSGYPVVSTTTTGTLHTAEAASDGPGMAERAKEKLASAKDKLTEAASTAGEKIAGAFSAAGEKLSDAGSAVGSKARAGMDYARERGQAIRRSSSRGGRALRARAGETQQRLRETSDEHPLAVGGACLAMGLLAGLLLPRSEREDEWLGEASDQMKDEARARGEEMLQRGKSMASQTAASAMDEAEARGITPGNLAEKATRVISEAVRAGKETAREEGLGANTLMESAKAVAQSAKDSVSSGGGQASPGTGPSQTGSV